MSTTAITFDLDAVYERTPAGQSEVLRPQRPLTDTERLALALFNGFTPLAELQAVVGARALPTLAVHKLFELGLICQAEAPRVRHYHLGWPSNAKEAVAL